MKPTFALLAICLLTAACAAPAPDTDVSSAATPQMAGISCATDGVGCTTPMTRADAVAADRRNGLGEATMRLMLRFW